MDVEINHKKKSEKYTKTRNLNNMFKHEWISNEIKGEIKRYLDTNDNKKITTPNLWDMGKAIQRGKFIALQPFSRNKKNLK